MIGALLQIGAVTLLGWGLVAAVRRDRRRRGEDDGDAGFHDGGGDCGDGGGDGGGD